MRISRRELDSSANYRAGRRTHEPESGQQQVALRFDISGTPTRPSPPIVWLHTLTPASCGPTIDSIGRIYCEQPLVGSSVCGRHSWARKSRACIQSYRDSRLAARNSRCGCAQWNLQTLVQWFIWSAVRACAASHTKHDCSRQTDRLGRLSTQCNLGPSCSIVREIT